MIRDRLIYIKNGIKFRKSSFSSKSKYCVGVSNSDHEVKITNLNEKDAPIINFTLKEWESFIKGVKNGEFDIYK